MNGIIEYLRQILGFVFALFLKVSGRCRRRFEELQKEDSVLPIYFHNPDKKLFEKLITSFLDRGFSFITYHDLKRFLEGEHIDYSKKIWLSFDDGWKGNLTNVIPVLIEKQIPATFFIPVGCNMKGYFWFTLIRKNIQLLNVTVDRFWKIPNSERLKIVSEVEDNPNLTKISDALTKEEISNISINKLFSFQNHTYSHAICNNCTVQELEKEIIGASLEIAKLTSEKVDGFAYPNGDYDEKTINFLKDNHFNIGATTTPGFITRSTNQFLLPRNSVMNNGGFLENYCHALGIWQPEIKKLKGITKYNTRKK